jgi:HD-GYP domain-containing protein (c-di-GMP phosphodiesterase class II)
VLFPETTQGNHSAVINAGSRDDRSQSARHDLDMATTGSGVRLSELLGAMSFGIDLAMGNQPEHVLRQTLLSLRLADRLGLDDDAREVVFYTSLLAWVGCHIDAYEQARWFGDDRALKHAQRFTDIVRPIAGATFLVDNLGGGGSLAARARAGLGYLSHGHRDVEAMFENHWRAASALAEELRLPPQVKENLAQTFERWDGRGEPEGMRGDAVLIASRLVALADVVVVFHEVGGVDAAVQVARSRRGTQFDPNQVDLFCTHAAELLDYCNANTWELVRPLLPRLDSELDDDSLDRALGALADFADLKSPYTLGHSRAVADLAAAGSADLGLDHDRCRVIHRAGLVHDLGRLGVPNSVWDKTDPLTAGDVERVRMHPYYAERMFASVPQLAPVATLASYHHERLDGSGYPRGVRATGIPREARILAAADSYRAWSEPRPHRSALSVDQVVSRLRSEVAGGRLDAEAVGGVLRAAGHRVRRERSAPAGLTEREVEVLCLVARGLSHIEIAERLVISRKTASNHVEHIYAKTGVRNRAMASLFATRHGLLDPATET